MNLQEWNERIRSERLPAVLVDLDAFDRNIQKIASIITDAKSQCTLRVATKSLRVPALISRVLKSGSPFKGLMCFSSEEAAFLAGQGFDDLLIAYPTLQNFDLKIIKELHCQGKRIQLIVDHSEHIKKLSSMMSGVTHPFPVIVEFDVSLRMFSGRLHLGARRSPIHTIESALLLLKEINSCSNLQFNGFMAYESQVAGLGDRNPVNRILNPVIRIIRRTSVKKVAKLRREFAEVANSKGYRIKIFNGGGTGSLSYAVNEPWLTELTAGSGFLAPHLFDYYSNLNLEPACYFVLPSVRQSSPNWVTCSGGGYIASGKPGWDKVPLPVSPLGARLNPEEGAGEVQTPLRLSDPISVGTPIFFRHAKAGELAERFNEYLLISNGRIVDRVKTYRGFGQCFF